MKSIHPARLPSVRKRLLASTAVLMGGLWNVGALATPVSVNISTLPFQDDVVGNVYVNADLTLGAISHITTSISGQVGAVYIGSEGAGVRAIEEGKKGTTVKGSDGISGTGGDALEALVLMFTNPIDPTSLQIGLNEYAYSCDKKANCGYRDDDLTLFLEDSLGNLVSFDSSVIEPLFPVGPEGFKTPLIDLSNAAFTAGLLSLIDLSKAYVRADDPGHFFVKSVTYDDGNGTNVPAPASLAVMSFGLAGVGAAMARRRRRK